jgi:hypothetical protein
MAPFVVRRSERIDYRVPVTLFATRDNVAPVVARSLDVSEGGMRLLAPIPMPVGAVVRCELTLDGRSALLEGRVAWMSQGSAPLLEGDDGEAQALGIGIRFETLTREESGVLRKLISQATEGYMPAELELQGVRAPVTARAVPTPTGARISAALPWLKRGAPVGVRFIGEPADVRGHIADAMLRELPNGGRRLQIEVESEGPTRVRRDTQYGDALEFERARPLGSGGAIDVEGVDTSSESTADPTQARSDAPALEAPARKLPGWLLFCAGLALGVAASAAWTKQQRATLAPVVRLSSSEAQAALQAGSLSAAAEARAHAAPEPIAAPIPEQPAKSPPADETPTSTALSTEGPAIVSSPNATTVRLPFQGTLEGMTSRIWADPYALAIDLPDGASSVALGRHALSDPEGIVSLVRVQAKGRALLVRLNLKRPIASHSVALTRGLLELHVVASSAASRSLTTP